MKPESPNQNRQTKIAVLSCFISTRCKNIPPLNSSRLCKRFLFWSVSRRVCGQPFGRRPPRTPKTGANVSLANFSL